jgi:protoporphyrinogen oxidase
MGFFTKNKLYPFTSPFDLLSFSAISFMPRLKLGILSFKSKRIKDWQKLSGISAKDWLIGEIGKEAYSVVWEPLLISKFGKYHLNVPASFVAARLSARAKSRGMFSEKLGYLKGSLSVLIDALAEKIKKKGGKIFLSSPVDNISRLSSFDKIILTIAPPLAAQIIKINNPTGYIGNICLILKSNNQISKYYWTNIGDASFPFCALVEQNNAFEDEGYNGKRIIYLSKYLDHEDLLWNKNDREILEIFIKDLKKIKPGFTYESFHVFRERYAQPLIALNYKIPPFETEKGRIYMVNNAQIYPNDRGLNDSIKLAKRFCDDII